MNDIESGASARIPHPARFAALMYPFGAMGGYLTVALAYQLAHAGVSTEAYELIVGVSLVPNMTRFLWAPLIDVTLSPRRWYLISLVLSVLSMIALSLVPPIETSLDLMKIVVFVGNIVVTFNSMSVDILAAGVSPIEQKGRFGGWIQAGNLGGAGVGGGLALLIAEHISSGWLAGTVVGLSFLPCALALVGLPPVAAPERGQKVLRKITEVAIDSWRLARSKAGALAILVLFLPLGTGAASNVWSNVADEWHAGADLVALVNGWLSGPASAIGCLIGGYLCDRMDRKWSYALFGVVQAGSCVLMAIAPRDPSTFTFFVLVYAFISGLCYAAFCSLTLEVVGVGAAATQYNLLACLSNVPIAYMGLVEGFTATHFGTGAMLYAEAAFAVAAACVYVGVKRLTTGPALATTPA